MTQAFSGPYIRGSRRPCTSCGRPTNGLFAGPPAVHCCPSCRTVPIVPQPATTPLSWKFSTVREADSCRGCSRATRGRISSDQESMPCCPRCRDTKSIFAEITGQIRDDVSVTSSRSRATIENVPAALQLSPMLARSFKDVKPEVLKPQISSSSQWIACMKYDGVRVLIYILDGHTYFLSRNRSKGNNLYADKTANVPHLDLNVPECNGTVLDGELLFTGTVLDTGSVVTSHILNATVALTNCDPAKSIGLQEKYGQLAVVVFDVLKHNGRDVRDLPLRDRIPLRDQIVDHLTEIAGPLYSKERSVRGDKAAKDALYLEIIAAGGEGIMYKDLNAPYCKSASSRPVSWVKRKVRQTVDGIITGFKPGEGGFTGLVGALEISVYRDGELTPVAMVSNLELLVRHEMTETDGTLKAEYLGRVVEVSFQEITSVSARGRHATLDRLRPDKDPLDCTWESMTVS